MKKIKIGSFMDEDKTFQVGLIDYVIIRSDTNEYLGRSNQWTKNFYKARRFYRKSDATQVINCRDWFMKDLIIKIQAVYLDIWEWPNGERYNEKDFKN